MIDFARRRRTAATLALALAVISAGAAAQSLPEAEAVAARLRALYPGTRIDSVQPAPVRGLYEVVMGSNIAYVEPSGQRFIFGHVWDMQAQRDLTAERLASIERIDPAALTQAAAVRTVHGSGRRQLYVFADPECGFCRQLERTLTGLTDATVITIPVALLSPASALKASSVLCAEAPAAAWQRVMLGDGGHAGDERCTAAVERNTDLARRLRVQGTPLLVAADGRRLAGAQTLPEIVAWLDAGGEPTSVAAAPRTGGSR
jgi:thiol:disulfide interchange protein DsbC